MEVATGDYLVAWHYGTAQPKPEPHKRVQARRKRQAAKVVTSVRAQCVERDGYCRFETFPYGCTGPSEWAHLGEQKRYRTRGMPAEVRHTTAGSLMLCRRHHSAYDRAHTLKIVPLTSLGADGPLRFDVRGTTYAETSSGELYTEKPA